MVVAAGSSRSVAFPRTSLARHGRARGVQRSRGFDHLLVLVPPRQSLDRNEAGRFVRQRRLVEDGGGLHRRGGLQPFVG